MMGWQFLLNDDIYFICTASKLYIASVLYGYFKTVVYFRMFKLNFAETCTFILFHVTRVSVARTAHVCSFRLHTASKVDFNDNAS